MHKYIFPVSNIIILEHKSDCINSEIEKYGNDIAKNINYLIRLPGIVVK
jgi:hypothetical protein